MEIERKFLVNELPPGIVSGGGKSIIQGYLMAENDAEVRVRRFGKKYFLTSKNGNGVEREETEVSISQEQFDLLWPVSSGRRIEKERHVVRVRNDLGAELDIYGGILKGLQLVEVEFPDTDQATQFQPPVWFGPEVTNDAQFSNRALAACRPDSMPDSLRSILGSTLLSVGSIPVMQFNGINHVIVISTRNNLRWIFPKGNPKSGAADEKVAAREAFEEAGVTGEFFGSPIPVHYWKGYVHYIIHYYPMLVSALHTSWDEKQERRRRVCTFDEAAELLKDAGLVEAMRRSIAALPTAQAGG